MVTSIAPGSIKICGNRDPELCRLAADAGADMLGFIFVPGTKRYVEPAVAAECVTEAKRSSNEALLAVGVFVDEDPARIIEISSAVDLDLVQLHGSERPSALAAIERPVIKVLRPHFESHDDIRHTINSFLGASNAPIAFLVDGYDARHYGGAAVKANWGLAAQLAADYPLMLAGGLNPENVIGAIESVGPRGVDVSSGVETEGVRDPEKIRRFITAAKVGFANLATDQQPLLSR